MNISDEKDALGNVNRKWLDEEARKTARWIGIIGIPLITLFLIGMIYFEPQDSKNARISMDLHQRDNWSCSQLDQDMILRGWKTQQQDNTDQFFVYDMKLHNQRGCNP